MRRYTAGVSQGQDVQPHYDSLISGGRPRGQTARALRLSSFPNFWGPAAWANRMSSAHPLRALNTCPHLSRRRTSGATCSGPLSHCSGLVDPQAQRSGIRPERKKRTRGIVTAPDDPLPPRISKLKFELSGVQFRCEKNAHFCRKALR